MFKNLISILLKNVIVYIKEATFSRKHSKEFPFSKANLLKAADWQAVERVAVKLSIIV